MFKVRKALFIIILFIFLISFSYTVTASTTGGTFKSTSNNYTYGNYYLINSTNSSGGWPFLENDIYNTLGVKVAGSYFYDYNSIWIIHIKVISLSSSRAKDRVNKTYTLKSHIIKVQWTPTNNNSGISRLTWPEWGWPHEGGNPIMRFDQPDLQLMSSAIDASNTCMPFPVNASVLNEELRSGSDTKEDLARYQVSSDGTQYWNWTYSAWPWGDKSDIVSMVNMDCYIPPESTFEFDVVSETDWGLLDKSEARIHVKLSTPPSPEQMNATELKIHGLYNSDNLTIVMS